MAGDASKGPPDTEQMHVERVLTRRHRIVTLLGRDAESGTRWVIKELHRPVREFPPADPKRSVWTRLVLPWRVEREGRQDEDHPSVHRGHAARRRPRADTPSARDVSHASRSTRSELSTRSTGLGLVHGAVKPSNVILDPATGRAWLVDPSAGRAGRDRDGTAPSEPLARYVSPELAGASGGPSAPPRTCTRSASSCTGASRARRCTRPKTPAPCSGRC